ncbi:hypothetical protein GF351_00050 [Candidatus Woesearchaeota archaeon]|nr:hypothetical protein [Candidatus Woesearchaeota archaeon]
MAEQGPTNQRTAKDTAHKMPGIAGIASSQTRARRLLRGPVGKIGAALAGFSLLYAASKVDMDQKLDRSIYSAKRWAVERVHPSPSRLDAALQEAGEHWEAESFDSAYSNIAIQSVERISPGARDGLANTLVQSDAGQELAGYLVNAAVIGSKGRCLQPVIRYASQEDPELASGIVYACIKAMPSEQIGELAHELAGTEQGKEYLVRISAETLIAEKCSNIAEIVGYLGQTEEGRICQACLNECVMREGNLTPEGLAESAAIAYNNLAPEEKKQFEAAMLGRLEKRTIKEMAMGILRDAPTGVKADVLREIGMQAGYELSQQAVEGIKNAGEKAGRYLDGGKPE